jgi:hypothetical protein
MKTRLQFLLLGTVAMNVCLNGRGLAQTQGGGDAQPDAYTYKRVDGPPIIILTGRARCIDTGSVTGGILREDEASKKPL